jgi:hypothetical protein
MIHLCGDKVSRQKRAASKPDERREAEAMHHQPRKRRLRSHWQAWHPRHDLQQRISRAANTRLAGIRRWSFFLSGP